MIVYAYWDDTLAAHPQQAKLVSLFYHASRSLGRKPRLLTARDALKSRAYKAAVKRGAAHKMPMSLWAFGAKRAVHFEDLDDYKTLL